MERNKSCKIAVWKYMSHENRNTHLMREIECAGSENPMRKFPVNHVIIYLWRSCDSSVMVSRASLINWVISPGHPGIDFLLGALGFKSPNSSKAPLLSNLPSPPIVFIISRGVWGCVRSSFVVDLLTVLIWWSDSSIVQLPWNNDCPVLG